MAQRRRSNRAWGGRFSKEPDAATQAFTASIGFDVRLYPYDVRASIAHANMLAACDIISRPERDRIVRGLESIHSELDQGRFQPAASDEDIHMAIERRLIEKVGRVGAKLHTARSRNDQVVTDVRLFAKDAIEAIDAAAAGLQKALVDVAARHADALMPGYTHMQRAQPVLLGHHLLAYHDMIGRDRERLTDCRKRVDVLPLGAGALAGTTLPINPYMVARELGFTRVFDNSMDAVADRDFVLEILSTIAILFTHLSRLAGEIVLWATTEYGFVALDDAYSTGSSMMPQKKNPDVAELVRGKSGRVIGNLVAVATAIKGLPLAYNSDLQEDKEPLFDSVDTALDCLRTLAPMVRSLTFRTDVMEKAASEPMMLATDLAEYLVAAGVPFRQSHGIVGRIVRHCLDEGIALTHLTPAQLRRFSKAFGDDVAALLDTRRSVDRRKAGGGTARANLKRRLRRLTK